MPRVHVVVSDAPRRSVGPRVRLLLAAVAVAVAAVGCGTDAEPGSTGVDHSEPVHVAFLNQGAAEDEPWTAAHGRAVANVRERFGTSVRIDFVERIDPEDAPAVIDDLVSDGVDLVISTSFPFGEALRAAAGQHPDVRFEQARGLETTDNLGVFSGADEEPLYLAGIAAAIASTSGVIGFVGTVEEPETVRHINALALGARSVNPAATVLVSWTDTWWDPDAEAEHARNLLEQGADVLATGFISTVTGDVARTSGVPWIGHDADWNAAYPEVWLTAAVPDWTNFYGDTIESVLDGTWKADNYYGSMADSFTDIATLGQRVPAAARERIEAERQEFVDGTRDVFSGPVRDNAGRERIAAGDTLDVEALLHMDFLVEGVTEVPHD